MVINPAVRAEMSPQLKGQPTSTAEEMTRESNVTVVQPLPATKELQMPQ